MAKSWVGPSSNRRLNTERKDTGLRKFVGLGGLSLPRSRARYFSANRSTWLILLIPLAVLIIGGVLTGILDYSLYFGITAFVATPTIPFAAKSYVDGAIHKRMQAIPEIDWTHPSARSWNEHVYRWIFANALFFLVSGCLLLGYNLINTASSEVISPTSQPNTLVFVLGMAMFLFSCLQVVPIIHFGLWPERDIPMKIARYTKALAKRLKERIYALPHFNVGKGDYAHMRFGDICRVIDQELESQPQSRLLIEEAVANLSKDYDSLMSHAWVLASERRITLEEQHWIADSIIPWASKAMEALKASPTASGAEAEE